jgi:hypothetical protein
MAGSLKRTQTKNSNSLKLYQDGTLKDFMAAAENPKDSVNLLDLPISQEVVPWPVQ